MFTIEDDRGQFVSSRSV